MYRRPSDALPPVLHGKIRRGDQQIPYKGNFIRLVSKGNFGEVFEVDISIAHKSNSEFKPARVEHHLTAVKRIKNDGDDLELLCARLKGERLQSRIRYDFARTIDVITPGDDGWTYMVYTTRYDVSLNNWVDQVLKRMLDRADEFIELNMPKLTVVLLHWYVQTRKARLVHADVKPSNMVLNLLSSNNNNNTAEGDVEGNNCFAVTDYGSAFCLRRFRGTQRKQRATSRGTAGYKPPEANADDPKERFLDHTTDLYGLAASIYVLCTKQLWSPGASMHEVPRILQPHLLRWLDVNPANRIPGLKNEEDLSVSMLLRGDRLGLATMEPKALARQFCVAAGQLTEEFLSKNSTEFGRVPQKDHRVPAEFMSALSSDDENEYSSWVSQDEDDDSGDDASSTSVHSLKPIITTAKASGAEFAPNINERGRLYSSGARDSAFPSSSTFAYDHLLWAGQQPQSSQAPSQPEVQFRHSSQYASQSAGASPNLAHRAGVSEGVMEPRQSRDPVAPLLRSLSSPFGAEVAPHLGNLTQQLRLAAAADTVAEAPRTDRSNTEAFATFANYILDDGDQEEHDQQQQQQRSKKRPRDSGNHGASDIGPDQLLPSSNPNVNVDPETTTPTAAGGLEVSRPWVAKYFSVFDGEIARDVQGRRTAIEEALDRRLQQDEGPQQRRERPDWRAVLDECRLKCEAGILDDILRADTQDDEKIEKAAYSLFIIAYATKGGVRPRTFKDSDISSLRSTKRIPYIGKRPLFDQLASKYDASISGGKD